MTERLKHKDGDRPKKSELSKFGSQGEGWSLRLTQFRCIPIDPLLIPSPAALLSPSVHHSSSPPCSVSPLHTSPLFPLCPVPTACKWSILPHLLFVTCLITYIQSTFPFSHFSNFSFSHFSSLSPLKSPPFLSFSVLMRLLIFSPASSLHFSTPSSTLLSFPHPPIPSSPPPAPPAVSYSDSDIITLVVTGFICTLWTYTSAWLIVQGPGPALPRPDWDRVTDRTVLKTTPAWKTLDIFLLLVLICQKSVSRQTSPCLK